MTFREEYIYRGKVTQAAYERRANVILHEMAHMWFGDLVTMVWWDDLWLKESFADFMGSFSLAEATAFTNSWVTFANNRKAWAYRADQLPSTHPITADIRDLEDAKLNFDGITYAKGASVLKQLVAYVGREDFLEGARRYFKRHAYGNTRLGDLLSVLEEVSGRDMAAWSRSWLQTAGVNSLTPVATYDADRRSPSSPSSRRPPPSHPDCARTGSRGPVPQRGGRPGALCPRRGRRRGPAHRRSRELAGAERPDLILVNDDDLTYCKIRFDEGSLATAARPPRRHRPTPWPAPCAGRAVEPDAGRAHAAPATSSPLVLAHAARESDIGVLQMPHAAQAGRSPLRDAPARRGRPLRRRAPCTSCGSPSRAASTS